MMRSTSHAIMVVSALVLLAAVPRQADAIPRQQTAPPPAAPAPQPTPSPAKWDIGPGAITGWSYGSLTGNAFAIDVIFCRARVTDGGDLVTWRGPLATASFGTKGFEVGAGYGLATMSLLSYGYQFRAVGGQVREPTSGLGSGQWYAGGEAAVTVLLFRFTGGVVVPVGNGTTSHKPVLKGSVGVVLTLPIIPLRHKQ